MSADKPSATDNRSSSIVLRLPVLGGPPQDFDFFKHARKINFIVYNPSMEWKLLGKTI